MPNKEDLPLGFVEGPHGFEDNDCPTFYDGCHCTVETLLHNINRAERAEACYQQMFRATCYACHNYAVAPDRHYHHPAVLVDGAYKHAALVSKTGYVACLANRLRLIVDEIGKV